MDPQGKALYDLLVELSGLDTQTADKELKGLMQKLKMCPETLTTDDVRRLMASYLEDVHKEMILEGGESYFRETPASSTDPIPQA
jgi:hypothetical protein